MRRPSEISRSPLSIRPGCGVSCLSVLVLAFCIGASAQAEIYKWTDAEGKVQFTDTPPAGADAKKVKVDGKPTAANPKRLQELNDTAKKQQEARAAKKAEVQKKVLDAEKISAHCDSAKATLESLRTSTRRQFTNAKGEREYIPEEQRQQWMQDAQTEIAKHCN